LDTREDFFKGGTDGPIVVPGRPEESRFIHAVRYDQAELRMPPPKNGGQKLPALAIADLTAWVKHGAPYPETPPSLRTGPLKPWSFAPLQDPPAPAVTRLGWAKTSVDPFVLSRLEARGAGPVSRADRRTLLRRVTFDLTGLPPTPDELAAFLGDTRPDADAFAQVVERLLASPHYGERWGRHWLDVVRYADTAGDTADYPVALAWRYRDYVVEAFNQDKPYDEFLHEQIAGDILAAQGPRERYAERVIATGFLALSRRFGFDSENYHHLTIQDTLDTIGQAALGLSLGCARCHDHKFDPIPMRDYYALYGIFESTRYAFPGSEQKGKLRAMVPLAPPEEAQPQWREYDQRVAALAGKIARRQQPVPSAVLRSLHDPDGDFEIQKDAAGGSYGVLVPPWLYSGQWSATTSAQSPFKNVYPAGRFGAHMAGGAHDYWLAQSLYPRRSRASVKELQVNLDFRIGAGDAKATGHHRFWLGTMTNSPAVEVLLSAEEIALRGDGRPRRVAGL
jgi:hypothetical protein